MLLNLQVLQKILLMSLIKKCKIFTKNTALNEEVKLPIIFDRTTSTSICHCCIIYHSCNISTICDIMCPKANLGGKLTKLSYRYAYVVKKV